MSVSHRSAVALAAAGALLAAAAPAASAAARPTITAAPNPTTTGDPVVIFGTAPAGAKVVLWHRIAGRPVFTVVQRTTADSAGRYEFTRADGVVTTNRNWFVMSKGRRSRTVHEKVSAEISLSGPDGQVLTTGTPYTFSGTISPVHAGDRVLLQRQSASANGDNWSTIDRGRIGPNGGFSVVHRFTHPGDADLRVAFSGDNFNIAGASGELSDTINQKQNPNVSLSSSANPIAEGATTDLSGAVAGVSAPVPVTLYGHVAGRGFAPVATVDTDASGNYAFPGRQPVFSTFYQVRGNGKHSAIAFLGVKDVVTAAPSSISVTAGDTVTFTGAVSPDKSGHVIVLERRNANGNGWHRVAKATIATGSTYTLSQKVVNPGDKVLRVRVPGGPENQAGVAGPFTISVAAAASPLT
jgi:plastocyanin